MGIKREIKNFGHNTKWYMYKWESILEKKTQTIHTDFEIKTDQLILVRISDLDLMKKEKEKRELAV